MYPYHNELLARIDRLTTIINEKKKALQDVPEGTLRINKNKNHISYYRCNSGGNKNGTYLSVGENALARALAQKAYDHKTLCAAEKELHLLLRLKKGNSELSTEEIYQQMSPLRQQLVTPIELPDEEYIHQWKSQPFTPKGFAVNAPEHYTSRGERVRSKSEILIADTLTDLNIPYHYEMPLRLGSITIHPDFTILHVPARKTLFLEHFGMMDDPEYANAAVSRIHLYIRHGILPGDSLIMTFETKNSPLNMELLKFQLKGLIQSPE